jgi:hypothetical protein
LKRASELFVATEVRFKILHKANGSEQQKKNPRTREQGMSSGKFFAVALVAAIFFLSNAVFRLLWLLVYRYFYGLRFVCFLLAHTTQMQTRNEHDRQAFTY